jgi:tellurite resistance protein TerC
VESLVAIALADFLGTPVWFWFAFLAIVTGLLAFDLGVLHRHDREIGVRESLALSAGYIAIGLLFGAWVWWQSGAGSGIDYFTGFLIEKSLSMDNVFVIAMIFTYFAVPRQYQHRVLFWGILGVIVLRAAMIGLGAALVSQFSWVLYVFGAFLLATGVKMLVFADQKPDLAKNPLLRFVRRHLRVTDTHHGNRFFVTAADAQTGKPVRYATPLFLALLLIEFADLIFAVDSVPAIFAITQDPFIVYTSNIFAILGLRALYFALAAMIHRFHYLKYALALVLIFIGAKIFLVNFIGKLPPALSLGVTIGLLAGGVLVSLWKTRPSSAMAGAERPGGNARSGQQRQVGAGIRGEPQK